MFGGFGRGSAPVDNETFYKRLGVDKNASASQLKKEYYKKAKTCHPDKHHGDEAKLKEFKELSHAYEILSDPEKRELYDNYGEEGLQMGNSGGGGGFFNPFERRSRGPPKAKSVSFGLQVTLKEMYNGTTKKIKIRKDVICSTCNGKGSEKEGAMKKCTGCRGQGVRFVRRQMGHSVVQMQAECDECDGRGESMDPKDRCTSCRGRKIAQETVIKEVEVDKGMQENQKITFTEEGDQAPGVIAGDIVVVIKEKESEEPFSRRGNDLIYEKEITILEALTGFEFIITHLDGRTLVVKSSPGDITQENDVKVIQNEGMPRHRNPFQKGFLFVHFTISWPKKKSISEEQAKILATIFPPKKSLGEVPEDSEYVTLEEFNERQHEQQQYQEAYEEEEERGPTCVQQ